MRKIPTVATNMKQLEPSDTSWWEYGLFKSTTWETIWQYLLKLNICIAHMPVIPFLGLHPTETCPYAQQRCLRMFRAALFLIAKKPRKLPKCLPIAEWIKHGLFTQRNSIQLWMNGLRPHGSLQNTVKWKKPETKEYQLNDPMNISTKKAELIYSVKREESSDAWGKGASVWKGAAEGLLGCWEWSIFWSGCW